MTRIWWRAILRGWPSIRVARCIPAPADESPQPSIRSPLERWKRSPRAKSRKNIFIRTRSPRPAREICSRPCRNTLPSAAAGRRANLRAKRLYWSSPWDLAVCWEPLPGGCGELAATEAGAAPSPTCWLPEMPKDTLWIERAWSRGGAESGWIESQWTRVGDFRMHARVSVSPARHQSLPVVLVHGIGITSRYWVPTSILLAPWFRNYAPDFPGFGLSDKPRADLRVPQFADWLAAWVRARRLRNVALVGNS